MTSKWTSSIAFAIAAGTATGVTIGIGTLMSGQDTDGIAQATAAPKNNRAKDVPVPHPTPAGSFTAVVTHVPQENVLHVRAHRWLGVFSMESVCVRGAVAEPKPCSYEADITQNQNNPGGIAVGNTVTLSNVSRAFGLIAPHTIAEKVPVITPSQDKLSGGFQGRVIKLTDGDTLSAQIISWPDTFVLQNIRIFGLNTPEKGGRAECQDEADLGARASAETARLLSNRSIVLRDISNDKFGGRALADVTNTDGVNIAAHLIGKGLAKPYFGEKKEGWCAFGAQKPAKKK